MAESDTTKTNDKYPSFAGTLRPKGGVTEDWLDALLCLFRKDAKNWKIITEKVHPETQEYTAESHFHFGVIWNLPMSLGNCKQKLERYFKKQISKEIIVEEPGEESNLKVAIKMRKWFQGQGWNEYMDKDMGVDSKLENQNIDKDIREYLWPHVPENERKRKAAWIMYEHLEKLWKEERTGTKPTGPGDCAQFLNEMSYAKRRIALPKTGKEMRQQAVHLYRYIHKYRGEHCIDDAVDEMRCGTGGPAFAGGFQQSVNERQSDRPGYN